mmetsp:Transcript_18619/g.52670  ORF Transcript_18619/g.52670 Transcript_18619/m.52670 type:complete len:414 (+) Transcript_18619:557-1798(+)
MRQVPRASRSARAVGRDGMPWSTRRLSASERGSPATASSSCRSHASQASPASRSCSSASLQFSCTSSSSWSRMAAFSSCQYSSFTASSPRDRLRHSVRNALRPSFKASSSTSSRTGRGRPPWPGRGSPSRTRRKSSSAFSRSSSESASHALCCTSSHAFVMFSIWFEFSASTIRRSSAARPDAPTAWPPIVFGLAFAMLMMLACTCSKPRRNSGRKVSYGISDRRRSWSSSTSGITSVEHFLSGKNRSKQSRTSFAPADLPPWFPGTAACKDFSRYSSEEMSCPDSSRRSSTKSRSSHTSAGLLASCPLSSTCSARLHTSESELKSPSLRTPLVFRRNTEDSRMHSAISFASRVLSASVLPKPSQSRKSMLPASLVSSRAPHIHTPSVHAFTDEPTRNCCVLRWMRPSKRFRR